MENKYSFNYSTANLDRYKLLKESAQRMRKYPTPAEAVLWNSLRGNKLGVKFHRQHIIGDYIADFVCLEKNLIIEADGEYHNKVVALEHDELRTDILKDKGYTILRFKNEQILNNCESVLDKIINFLETTTL